MSCSPCRGAARLERGAAHCGGGTEGRLCPQWRLACEVGPSRRPRRLRQTLWSYTLRHADLAPPPSARVPQVAVEAVSLSLSCSPKWRRCGRGLEASQNLFSFLRSGGGARDACLVPAGADLRWSRHRPISAECGRARFAKTLPYAQTKGYIFRHFPRGLCAKKFTTQKTNRTEDRSVEVSATLARENGEGKKTTPSMNDTRRRRRGARRVFTRTRRT